jgi:glycosyltransferase involved in cell wall biosynthesis
MRRARAQAGAEPDAGLADVRLRPGPPTPRERIQQSRRLLSSEGWSGVSARLRSRAAQWIDPPGTQPLPLCHADAIRAAEIAASPPPLLYEADRPLQIAWVCVPQAAGAGGFTTILRLIGAFEQAGHRCTLYLHDRHGWSLRRHELTMRAWWPALQAPIRDAAAGIDDAHAIFATSWETAYQVRLSPAAGARMYLVQDFEPAFHPAGSLSLLAQATYEFGFHGLTAGRWLAIRLQREYGMQADHFDLGADLAHYCLQADRPRQGVCMYARPSTPRRAVELGIAALALFARRHPEVEIHLYGERIRRLPFPARQHGLLHPAQLNELYNRCIAGLCLSATNVSLVPLEMLAAGCIPVLNDAASSRIVLENPQVRYAPATPFDLAGELSALVQRSSAECQAAARAAADSVRGARWQDAGEVAIGAVMRAVQQAARPALEQAALR